MARTRRIKSDDEAYYHVIDRVAHGAFLLEKPEIKRMLLDCLQRAAEFSGIEVGAYALMDNHIHLCIHVPPQTEIDDEELLRRIEILYGTKRMDALLARWCELRDSGDADIVEKEMASYRKRMGDLSEFMKTFKQRFSQWYNATYRHEGALWCGRFKSIMVEDGEYLHIMVNYIHGNPVRAGMVTHASDYEWCSLGAARRGNPFAIKGLSLVGIDVNTEVEAMARDRRFSNGKIIGSARFVTQTKATLGMVAATSPRRQNSFTYGGHILNASHGHRSAPRHAA